MIGCCKESLQFSLHCDRFHSLASKPNYPYINSYFWPCQHYFLLIFGLAGKGSMAATDVPFDASEFWRADDEACFTRSQIATVVKFSVSALEQWALKGCGPVMLKIGRRVLYKKKAVLEWMERSARRISSTSAIG